MAAIIWLAESDNGRSTLLILMLVMVTGPGPGVSGIGWVLSLESSDVSGNGSGSSR